MKIQFSRASEKIRSHFFRVFRDRDSCQWLVQIGHSNDGRSVTSMCLPFSASSEGRIRHLGLESKIGTFWDHFGTLVPFGTKSRIRDFVRAPGFCNIALTWCYQVMKMKGLSPVVIKRYQNLYTVRWPLLSSAIEQYWWTMHQECEFDYQSRGQILNGNVHLWHGPSACVSWKLPPEGRCLLR